MTQTVFSPAFWEKFSGRSRRLRIAAVDREAQELAVAGVFSNFGDSLVWLGGENEAQEEKREKIRQWLKFFGREDVPVHIHALPY